jgi:hypothetical protein
MKEIFSAEMLVDFQRTTWSYIPEESNLRVKTSNPIVMFLLSTAGIPMVARM